MPIRNELLGVDNEAEILPLQCEGKFCVSTTFQVSNAGPFSGV